MQRVSLNSNTLQINTRKKTKTMLLLQLDALHLVLGNQDILHTSHRTVEKKTGSQKQILAPPLLMLIYSKEEEKKKPRLSHSD